MNLKHIRHLAITTVLVALHSAVLAQGGGADFTRVVSSQVVNGHWLVKLQDAKRTFVGDFTNADLKMQVNGQWVTLSRPEAERAMVPGARLFVRTGRRGPNGIIAILIGLFVER